MQTEMINTVAVLDQPAGRPIPSDPNALLFPLEVAYLLGLDRRTLDSWRLRGDGPRFVRISARAIRYRRADLLAWIEARIVSSTSEPTAAD